MITPKTFIIILFALLIAFKLILKTDVIGFQSWDLDHFMYSGQRLLKGDLLWTVEYDDKLLITQFFFILPALYESEFVWVLLSAVFIIFGAWACFNLVDNVISKSPSVDFTERKSLASTAAILMVFLFLFLPGGIYQINAVSASFSVISLALIVRSLPSKKESLKIMPFFISAISASISIGIRPYFFLSLIIGVSLLIMNRSKSLFGRDGAFNIIFLWIFIIGIFGVLVNVVPYIIIGDLNAFYAGMFIIFNDLNLQTLSYMINNMVSTIYHQTPFIILLFIISFVSIIYALYSSVQFNEKSFKRHILNEIIILIFILPTLLLVLIFSRHFWAHYIQLFAPFLAMSVSFFFLLLKQRFHNQLSKIRSKTIWVLTIIFVIIFLPPVIINDFSNSNQTEYTKLNNNHSMNKNVNQVATIVSMQPEDQSDFLFLNDMRSHWMLDEPRHGFPNAAHSNHILHGQWQRSKLTIPSHFDHPINFEEYCMMLEKKGPTLIFIKAQLNFQTSCLQKSSFYRFEKKLSKSVNLFLRN